MLSKYVSSGFKVAFVSTVLTAMGNFNRMVMCRLHTILNTELSSRLLVELLGRVSNSTYPRQEDLYSGCDHRVLKGVNKFDRGSEDFESRWFSTDPHEVLSRCRCTRSHAPLGCEPCFRNFQYFQFRKLTRHKYRSLSPLLKQRYLHPPSAACVQRGTHTYTA